MKLSKKQEAWLSHLSKNDVIKIVPFDQNAEEKFREIELCIKDKIGEDVEVKHCGASSLGISGQDEIDIYIPISKNKFDKFTEDLIELFGNPGSNYPLERIRFKTNIDGKRVDVFLINKDSDGWLNSVKFEDYLRDNKDYLKKYEKLKERGNGMNVQEYYRMKLVFINDVLEKCS
jgi:GrpB-like predicted nucleotidyltransferase (UPF0157 family)